MEAFCVWKLEGEATSKARKAAIGLFERATAPVGGEGAVRSQRDTVRQWLYV